MPTLATKKYCTGCTACASACPKGCITMAADEDGFLCPTVDHEKCVECGLCKKSCPIISPLNMGEKEPKAYAAYSTDEEMRLSSSSGGIFTELSRIVLKNGGTVFGAAYNDEFEVIHICVETEADLAKLRGAKYAQSDLRGIFAEVKTHLKKGQQVLFSGTPCQVGGLKAFLRKDYENLVTVDFVCHSVPSPMAWKEYVKYRAEHDNGGRLPVFIDLRSKMTGWSRYKYSNLFDYGKSNHISRSGESLYMKLFVGGYISRESCVNCQFKGYSRVSDLTIGDFWGIWDIAPEMDDNKGTSVVLVQSERGSKLLDKIAGKLIAKEVTLEEAGQQNQSMLETAETNARSADAFELIRSGRISSCKDLFQISKTPVMVRVRQFIKSVIKKVLGK